MANKRATDFFSTEEDATTLICAPAALHHSHDSAQDETVLDTHVGTVSLPYHAASLPAPAQQKATTFAPSRQEAALNRPLPTGYTLQKKFRIDQELGRGAFGVTYLAWDCRLNCKRVIKECLPKGITRRKADGHTVEALDGQEDIFSALRTSFLTEARALAELSHPNIVSIIDFIVDENGTDYYVMEYIPTEQSSSGTPLNWPQLMQSLLRALCYLHGQQRLHVDIKPANILFKKGGLPIFIDFGSSVRFGAEAVAYSPFFAAPELKATRRPDVRTDIYALGITLQRLAAGAPVPPGLGIERAIHPDAAQRWQSAQEWLDALGNEAPSSPCKLIIPGCAAALPADRRHLSAQVQAGTSTLHLAATAWTPEDTDTCLRILNDTTKGNLRLLVYHVANLGKETQQYVAEIAEAVEQLYQNGILPDWQGKVLSLLSVRQVISEQAPFHSLLQSWMEGETPVISSPAQELIQQAKAAAESLARPLREQEERRLQIAMAACHTPHDMLRWWTEFRRPEAPTPSPSCRQKLQQAATLTSWAGAKRPNKRALLHCLKSTCDILQTETARKPRADGAHHLRERCKEWEKRGALTRLFRLKEHALLSRQKDDVLHLLRRELDEMQAQCFRALLKEAILPQLEKEAQDNANMMAEIQQQLSAPREHDALPWQTEYHELSSASPANVFPADILPAPLDEGTFHAQLRQAQETLASRRKNRHPLALIPYAKLKEKVRERWSHLNGEVYTMAEVRLFPDLKMLIRRALPSAKIQEMQMSPEKGAVLLQLTSAPQGDGKNYLSVTSPSLENRL